MREILFRGKQTDNGEWIEGAYSPFHLNFGEREEKPHIIIISDDEDIDGLWCEVIPETVGQYTGLTDKNGVKIFKGDIIKTADERIGVVHYSSEKAAFVAKNIKTYKEIQRWTSQVKSSEVIGNIHDNPELLGGENNGINR